MVEVIINKKNWFSQFPTPGTLVFLSLFIVLVVGLADYSHQLYLLFPELGALAFVIVRQPAGAWARSPLLLCLTPFLTALVGVVITRKLAYGPLSVGLDVAIAICLIRLLRSPIAPAISAGVLPLALGITNWSYPLGILFGTGFLVLGSRLPLTVRQRLLSASQRSQPTIEPPGEWERASAAERRHPWRWIFWMAVFLGFGVILVSITGSRLVIFQPW